MTACSPATVADELLGPVRTPADRPFVLLKYAQTLDGRIAATGGDSKWISSDAERCVTHALRARCDAIMVGIGTVLSDDPLLTVRMVPGPSPRRVVLDSRLRTPPDAALLDGDPGTIVLTSASDGATHLERPGVEVHRVAAGPDGIDLPGALRDLRAAGVRSVLVEGGAKVLTAMLAAGVVDRVVVAVAPRILGSGVEAVGDLGHRRIADGIALRRMCVRTVGDDLLIGADVEPAG
ncbi:RibD family protein [Pseudonocardia nematodicida]|uniref:RibD family protein n=1 Tax=Pseudonocardia nematodicida TaxID=1206997 RepID=A0ABV1KFY7_9PSEU